VQRLLEIKEKGNHLAVKKVVPLKDHDERQAGNSHVKKS